jgi:dipeptidyl aminopeptidase/acylaminoacyl peptidase
MMYAEVLMTTAPRRRVLAVLAAAAPALLLACDDDDRCDTRNPLMPVCAAVAPPLASERVAFSSDRDDPGGPLDIYAMNADGSGVVRLTANPGLDWSPSWSPDGSRIVWSSVQPGAARQLYTMNADGSDVRQLTNQPGTPGFPHWSPDGARIAYHVGRGDGNWDIWVIGADGTAPTRLTTAGSGQRPRWSPDGQRILYTSHHQGGTLNFAQITVMNADGSAPVILAGPELQARHADWSPDGRQIAFSIWEQMNGGLQGMMRLAIMNADGTGVRVLGLNTMGVNDIAWSRTTGRIYFASWMTGFNQLYSVRPDGTDLRRLTGLPFTDNALPGVR